MTDCICKVCSGREGNVPDRIDSCRNRCDTPKHIKAWSHAAPNDGVWVGTIGEVAYGSLVEARAAAPGREVVQVWIVLAPHDQEPVTATQHERELREAWEAGADHAAEQSVSSVTVTADAAFAAWIKKGKSP